MKGETYLRLFVVGLLMIGGTVAAWGDCGSIPFYAPLFDFDLLELAAPGKGQKTIGFDPLAVTVFEPQQRAIIVWNGKEEVLLLSTDQRATQKTAVLEVIPLPAEPTVRLGSFKTFEAAQRLMVEKRMWACAHGGVKAGMLKLPKQAGRITFQEKLGAHDITVAEVMSSEGFMDFVQSYLQRKYQTPEAPIRPEFVKIIQSYLAEGFRWFAFDVIFLDGTAKSREPIEYRFKSDCVFYPMRISTMERGETRVDLLVFTEKGATEFDGLASRYFDREPQVEVTNKELEGLDKEWQGFFGEGSNLVVDQWRIEGDITTFVADVRVR